MGSREEGLDPISAAALKQKIIITHFANKRRNNIAVINNSYMEKSRTILSEKIIFSNLSKISVSSLLLHPTPTL
jgi:hypothetical protein